MDIDWQEHQDTWKCLLSIYREREIGVCVCVCVCVCVRKFTEVCTLTILNINV